MLESTTLPGNLPAEDGVYHIHALRYARALHRRAHENFVFRDMHDGPMPVDYSLWILRNAHRTILVDTGFGERAAAQRHRKLDIDPVLALSRIGIDPDTIDDIIVTHLHFDHAGNIGRFGGARFHIQDAEVGFATGRCMCQRYLRAAFDVEDVVAMVRHTYAERVCFHDGDASPFPGITLHVLPGHSVGLQAVRVMTPRGPVLLASDVSHYYANFLGHAPSILTVDMRATMRSYDRLMELGGSVDRIIPGHDPMVRELYPTYTIAGVDIAALHEEPKPHRIEDLARAGAPEAVGPDAPAPRLPGY